MDKNKENKSEYFMLNEGKADMCIGIFFLLFSLALLFIIIPTTIKDVDVVFPKPRSLPTIYGWILLILSIPEFFIGFFKNKQAQLKNEVLTEENAEVTFKKKGIPQALLCFAIVLVSVILLKWLPYIPVTIAMLAALMYAIGYRKWLVLGIVSVVLPILIYFFFTEGLRLVLP